MQKNFSGAALILGGARSGKSTFAEKLAAESGLSKIYLATSEIWDGGMEQRVELHRARRGPEWTLVEEPLALVETLSAKAVPGTCVLVDCLTLWLTNLMMAERDVDAECNRLTDAISGLPEDAFVLFVSNEVGQGIVPMEKMARDFRDHAGLLHQKLAGKAKHVWFVTAGLPQKLK
ncbi:MAG: bifunctional adenosylcobinamide kinase/adenosylcobinamide-phosphate guanylyltransferase [Pseudomonadota bacterium]